MVFFAASILVAFDFWGQELLVNSSTARDHYCNATDDYKWCDLEFPPSFSQCSHW